MRTTFRAYYPPSPAELDDLWTSGRIILDANALLNLFRYSADSRDAFLEVLRSKKDALWLPHQVGLEFQRNRHEVIFDQGQTFTKVVNALESARKTATGELSKLSRHPLLDASSLIRKLEESTNTIVADVKQAQQKYSESSTAGNQYAFDQLSQLYEGRVGSAFSEEALQAIYKEGAQRYEKKIPPGYQDSNKGEPRMYGDLVVWKQILEQGSESKRSAIFVTDDAKDDWWVDVHGQKKGPRPELVDEYFAAAGARIHFYTPDRFLNYATQHGSTISEAVLSEVEDLSSARSIARAVDVLTRQREALILQRESLLSRLQHRGGDSRAQAVVLLDRIGSAEAELSQLIMRRASLSALLHTHQDTADLAERRDDAESAAMRHRSVALAQERQVIDTIIAEVQHQLAILRRELDRLESGRVERERDDLNDRLADLDEQIETVTFALDDLLPRDTD